MSLSRTWREVGDQLVTVFAADAPQLQRDYADCWAGLQKRFDPTNPNAGTP